MSCQLDQESELLKAIAALGANNLFGHSVQETVVDSAVDYFTLGWTRMLQAVLDLAPARDLDKLLSKLHNSSLILTLGLSLVKSSNAFFFRNFPAMV